MSAKQTTILVVDDDREIREMLVAILENENYKVIQAADGHAGLAAVTPDVQAIVLDVEMPIKSGLEVLEELRKRNPVPVLILSSRAEGKDRITGLDQGADDYLGKPFIPEELVARVRALLRRANKDNLRNATPGGVRVDEDNRRVFVDDEPLELTPREYEMVRTLVGRPGRNFTRDELLERVWGLDSDVTTRQVDLIVSKVRAKFKSLGKDNLIRSVWGVGYRFEA